jgi:hypothetical protein
VREPPSSIGIDNLSLTSLDAMFLLQAEELNRFRESDVGRHYGYPYCWTEYFLPEPFGNGIGTVWAWPDFMNDQNFTDAQCRSDFLPPIVSMQAHSAPLGITFYMWNSETPVECLAVQSFPQWMDGYAFIAFHGSWNRDVPTGYKVVYIAMDGKGDVASSPIDLLAHQPPNANWEDGFRPVDVEFDVCGRLIITSDGTENSGSKIVRIEWLGVTSEEPSMAPSIEQDVTGSVTNSSHAPTNETSPSIAPSFSRSQESELPSEAASSVPLQVPTIEPSWLPTQSVSAPASLIESSSNGPASSISASSSSRLSTVLLFLVFNLSYLSDYVSTN